MVRKTVETTIKLTVPVRDLRRALRLPKWGRLEIGNLHAKKDDGTAWEKVDGAVPAYDDVLGGCVTFTSYQTKTSSKRLR